MNKEIIKWAKSEGMSTDGDFNKLAVIKAYLAAHATHAEDKQTIQLRESGAKNAKRFEAKVSKGWRGPNQAKSLAEEIVLNLPDGKDVLKVEVEVPDHPRFLNLAGKQVPLRQLLLARVKGTKDSGREVILPECDFD